MQQTAQTFEDLRKDRKVRVTRLHKETNHVTKKSKIGKLDSNIELNKPIGFKNHPTAKGYFVSGILVSVQPKNEDGSKGAYIGRSESGRNYLIELVA